MERGNFGLKRYEIEPNDIIIDFGRYTERRHKGSIKIKLSLLEGIECNIQHRRIEEISQLNYLDMYLSRNLLTIQRNSIIQLGYNLYFTAIRKHEVKRFELFHLLNGVDEWEGKDDVGVDRLEVALNLWVVFRVNRL